MIYSIISKKTIFFSFFLKILRELRKKYSMEKEFQAGYL